MQGVDVADQGVLQEVQQDPGLQGLPQDLGPLAPQLVQVLLGLLQAVTEVDLVLHMAAHRGTLHLLS